MITIANANALHIPLADQSVQCVVTSPPYWGLRDYGTARWDGGSAECDHTQPARVDAARAVQASTLAGGKDTQGHLQEPSYRDICAKCGARRIDAQIGLESTPAAYVAHIVAVMRECRRVLRDDGTLWLNLGDSYASGEVGRHDAKTDRQYGKRDNGNRQQNKLDTGLKPKDLCGIPWRVAFALQGFALISIDEIAALCRAIDARDIPALDYFRAGFRLWEELSGMDWFYNRIDVIWHKPNPMPESVTDRPTKAHEYVFLLTKQARYYYDAEAIKEGAMQSSGGWQTRARNGLSTIGDETLTNDDRNDGGACIGPNRAGTSRNRRSVWTVATSPYSGAHFATFPPALIEPMILAGSRRGDVVLDPFAGSGTTGAVAVKHGRRAVLLDLSTKYIDLQFDRNSKIQIAMPM